MLLAVIVLDLWCNESQRRYSSDRQVLPQVMYWNHRNNVTEVR